MFLSKLSSLSTSLLNLTKISSEIFHRNFPNLSPRNLSPSRTTVNTSSCRRTSSSSGTTPSPTIMFQLLAATAANAYRRPPTTPSRRSTIPRTTKTGPRETLCSIFHRTVQRLARIVANYCRLKASSDYVAANSAQMCGSKNRKFPASACGLLFCSNYIKVRHLGQEDQCEVS